MMQQVMPGDVIVGVGTYIGLYTVALAKRVGPNGKVIAFEPDPKNFAVLRNHCLLNKVDDRVEVVSAAVAHYNAEIAFAQQSAIAPEAHIYESTSVCMPGHWHDTSFFVRTSAKPRL